LHHLEPFKESLTGRRSFEIPRGSKSIASRDVAALDRFGGLARQTMEACPNVQRAWQVLPGCPDIGLMVIGDDSRWLGLGRRPCAAEERLGGGQVPLFTKQYVDHLAVLIDGAVEVPLDGATEEEDLVDVPTAAKPMTMPAGCGRELWTEGLGPAEHGPGRDINATLTKELGYLPGGERVAQVPTDRGNDDLGRPTVAREGAAGSVGEVPMTEMAGEALTAAAVETITRGGGLVAGRAGSHRPTLPRAPHDFADSVYERAA
jgi:hypothetical protein